MDYRQQMLLERIHRTDLSRQRLVGPMVLAASLVGSVACIVLSYTDAHPPVSLPAAAVALPTFGALIWFVRSRVLLLYALIQELSREQAGAAGRPSPAR
ncbi:MAG TPA: hypothetical protein VHV55_18535 [Pirellulales bacterium]|jgi:hypothetical protein|nr:hypothetical protein [Pirellulales bacterium]